MKDNNNKSKIVEVFTDVNVHRSTADIIRRHSTNQNDVREIAFEGLNLEHCRNILDLGCAFGFFTEVLKGKVHPEAIVTGVDIIGNYEPLFLNACQRAGVKGAFRSSGVSVIKDFKDSSFDLILSSYSLYFFPEMVPDISRILNSDGLLVAISHDKHNMGELVSFAKDALGSNGMLKQDTKLPIEIFISKFSSENGCEILSPWFENIRVIDFKNSLFFQPDDISPLIKYFRFKCPFLLSDTPTEARTVVEVFENYLQESFHYSRNGFKISKGDTIFVCSKPSYGRGAVTAER